MTEKEYLVEIGIRIKIARYRKKITIIKMAELCNMDKTNLGEIELGKRNTQILTIRKIATALEVNISELLP